MTTNAKKWSDLTFTKTGCVSLNHLTKEQKESYKIAVETVLRNGHWRGTILESKEYLFQLSSEARELVEQYIHLTDEGFFYSEMYEM